MDAECEGHLRQVCVDGASELLQGVLEGWLYGDLLVCIPASSDGLLQSMDGFVVPHVRRSARYGRRSILQLPDLNLQSQMQNTAWYVAFCYSVSRDYCLSTGMQVFLEAHHEPP